MLFFRCQFLVEYQISAVETEFTPGWLWISPIFRTPRPCSISTTFGRTPDRFTNLPGKFTLGNSNPRRVIGALSAFSHLKHKCWQCLCFRFIKRLEDSKKLLRNYTQNIDTLEQVAGIENVIECHGSFATASCTRCKSKVTSENIRSDILEQKIPYCAKCCELNRQLQSNGPDSLSGKCL